MTLYRQLILLISALYLLIFAGTFVIIVDNTRQYLVDQLQSHAQDTATSLGLSLSSPQVSGDALMMKSMVDAVFDRGEYRQITVETMDGKPLVERVLPVRVHAVPEWFVNQVPLDTPEGTSKVMSGWKQVGELRVRSHPGLAYRQLWTNAVDTFRWSLVALLAAVVVSGLALQFLLRSLRAVENQALAIADQEFPIIENIPRTRELRRVVTAMNRMTQKISGLLSDLYEEVERLRSAVYEDSVTGLGNEAAFKRDLERLVADREEHAYGVVVLLRMRGLDEANRANSYALGDELLKKSAAALVQIPEKYHGDAARIGGALFGIVIPDMPRSDFDNIVSPLVRELAKVKVGEFEAAGVNLGLAYYGGGQSAQVLKERAEAALNNAEREGANKWHIYDASETAAGRDLSHEKRWLEIIEVVIQRRAVVLAAQAVKSPDLEAVLHREVFARIRPGEGEAVSAGVFLPMAARVGLSERLDKTIIEATVDAVTQAPSAEGRYALNLTRYSVASGAFHDWLVKLLRNRGQEARRLCFEVAEGVVASHRDEALELAGRIRETGAQFGVDHGGARDLALEYLKRLKADYIKIDGPLITGLEDDPERQAYLKQLLATARGLDIRTVALHIESPETLAAARELGFDAFQGYHIGRPEAL